MTISPPSATGTKRSRTRLSRSSRPGFKALSAVDAGTERRTFFGRAPRNELQLRLYDWHREIYVWRPDDTPVIRVGTRHHHDAAIGDSPVNARRHRGRSRRGNGSGGWR